MRLCTLFNVLAFCGIIAAAGLANAATVSTFTGGDAGEGLDLDGFFRYAVNVNGDGTSVAAPNYTIRDATFRDDYAGAQLIAGVRASYTNAGSPFHIKPEYGPSGNDNNLEEVMHDIGAFSVWHELIVTPGKQYKLQAMYGSNLFSAADFRKFDVSLYDGGVGGGGTVYDSVDELSVPPNNWVGAPDMGRVVTTTFTALSDKVTLQHFNGSTGSDNVPILNAFTLEDLQVQGFKYASAVSADNPHGYWRLGEAVGLTAFNEVGSPTGENGTYVNGSVLGAGGIPGAVSDTAVNFDGNNDFVRVLDPHDPTDYTLEAWVKLDSLPSSWANILWRTNSGETSAFSHMLQVLSDGTFRHYTHDGASRQVDSTTKAQPGQWYHVVGEYHPGAAQSGFMSIYIDGELEKNWMAGPLNNPWTGGDRWLLAKPHGTGSNYFDGTIDEVAVYDSLLGAAVIKGHYKAGTVPEPITMLAVVLSLGGLGRYVRRRRA